jgi:uncharacterized protein
VTPSSLAVICKAPRPGLAKTRLSPPFTPDEAAELAAAALDDTFSAVLATPAARRIAVIDGPCGPWLPAGIEVLRQRGAGLDDRLASAFEDIGGPALILGMDTPQLTSGMLTSALGALGRAPAVLGEARDGGFWAIGLREPEHALLRGVPMSSPWTGEVQRRRLTARFGRPPAPLVCLTDVDDAASARAVAAAAPHTAFAQALAEIDARNGSKARA